MSERIELDDEERAQLRQLLAVYDNPTITATWRKDVCERLAAKGLAFTREPWDGIVIFSITPRGVEEGRRA